MIVVATSGWRWSSGDGPGPEILGDSLSQTVGMLCVWWEYREIAQDKENLLEWWGQRSHLKPTDTLYVCMKMTVEPVSDFDNYIWELHCASSTQIQMWERGWDAWWKAAILKWLSFNTINTTKLSNYCCHVESFCSVVQQKGPWRGMIDVYESKKKFKIKIIQSLWHQCWSLLCNAINSQFN